LVFYSNEETPDTHGIYNLLSPTASKNNLKFLPTQLLLQNSVHFTKWFKMQKYKSPWAN
jgi:hypothetical protein